MSIKRNEKTDDMRFAETDAPLQLPKWSERRVSIAFTGATGRVTLPALASILEFTATENCFVNFGDGAVEATSTITTDGSRLYLAGVQNVVVPIDPATDLPFTHIAAIQQSAAGTLQLEEVD